MGEDASQTLAGGTPADSGAVAQETLEERLARIKIFDRESISGRFCGFIDILGFGAATQNDLPAVLSLYEKLLDRAEFLQASRPPVRISVYSDSFVLVSPQLPALITCATTLQWLVLLEDYLVRGGIAYGDHAEGEKSGTRFIVSAGIARAAAVEKTVKWPCVAIHPDLEFPDEYWLGESRPLLYFDGLRMVNPFNKYWFNSAMIRAHRLAKQYPEHAAKYEWFLRLYEAAKVDGLIPADVIGRLRAKYPGLIVLEEQDG